MKKQILLIIIVTLVQTFTSFAQTQVYSVGVGDVTGNSCGPGNIRYTNPGSSFQVRWTSTGTGRPVSVSVSLNYAVNCAAVPTNDKVRFNNSYQEAQPTPGPYSCSCSPSVASPTTWNLNPSDYNVGGLNVLDIEGMASSEGINLLPGYSGVYAIITVNYAAATADQEINIQGNTTSIVNGDSTPKAVDNTEYGFITTGSTVDNNFTIKNQGVNDLNLASTPITISGSSNFSILSQPASNIIAGGTSQTFTVRFVSNTSSCGGGDQNAVVSIASDDADENPYTFAVHATEAVDTTNPVAIAKNISVQLDATGNVTVNAEDLNDNSTDNCGISNYKIASGTSGTVCNTVNEGSVLSLTAPSGVFTNVVFASYGNPTGSCGNYSMGWCNASNSVSTVSGFLLGQSTANITADNNNFGDPCNGTQKRLAVEAAYGPSSSSATGSITYTCADLGNHDVVLYVTDNNGNVSSVNATITVEDTALPTITCATIASSYNNDAGVCSYTVSDTSLDPVAADNCSVTVLNDFNNSATLNGAIFPLGTTTVIWTATDAAGNTATCTYDIVIIDTEKPTITCAVPAASYNNDLGVCSFTVVDNSLDPVAADNCSTVSVLNNFNNSATLNGAIFPVGTTNVIWTVTDAAGNTETCNYDVAVVDAEAPIVSTKNITVQLDVTGNATITGNDVDNGSADVCNGTLTYSVSPNTFNCTNVGANTVTLTVTDANGNFDTATATVTIEDKTAPIVLTKNITIQFDTLGNASIAAADVDNGSITVCGGSLTLAVSPSSFTCANAGANTVTLTATGTNGEISSETAIVTVLENIAPIVQTQDITVELDEAGNVSVMASQVNNGSSDNCGIGTITLSKTSFDCTNVGANTVVLTVVDKSGNTATATAKVTVVNKFGDNDNDGILDNCDTDDDNDGVLDPKDNCPITANPYQEDRNNNGIGDTCDKDQMNISEAFTPNGDGINDTWVISNIENHPASVVRVFNRWGAEVFTARNYQNNWDGQAKGQSSTLPAASSYYYQIDLDGNGTIDRQGWIYINR
ncbi:gliding motility-associated C-terminal domain-containing protein [Flavobacterium pectinovorum]|uniref:T9SS type B sorting domain-containing protein n=1 Tax=Flavobacterium pectinovorum TaxID=29533 RepID=UPI00265E4FA0|nr:gliding motility-associated C-terminal domain-containing protein [Flavobacterium pectinovorum]WKL46077.1 gliding motility-associated C-terminal domain-containing protein [Flavobacterium pectinovorum]